jgi:diguanylate cyclase (GGDEF)-like protein
MAIRGEDRPKKAKEGSKRRGAGATEELLSVTVSIGAAGPSGSAPTPHHVIKAADEALYRAKKAGRNRVSK